MFETLPASLVANPSLSQWLRFEREGSQVWVNVFSGKVEIGQGILTALSAIVAQALQLAPDQVRMVPASTLHSPNEAMTSGSLSVQDSGAALKHVCSQVKQLILEQVCTLFAERGNPIQSLPLSVHEGSIFDASGVRLSDYWSMDANACLKVDAVRANQEAISFATGVGNPGLASHSEPILFRKDLPSKFSGAASFIQDQHWPGMLYGYMLRPRSIYRSDEDNAQPIIAFQTKLLAKIEGFAGKTRVKVYHAASQASPKSSLKSSPTPCSPFEEPDESLQIVRDSHFAAVLCSSLLVLSRIDRTVSQQLAIPLFEADSYNHRAATGESVRAVVQVEHEGPGLKKVTELKNTAVWLKSAPSKRSIVREPKQESPETSLMPYTTSTGPVNQPSLEVRSFAAQVFKPWLSHASVGLSCAIARWTPQRCLEIWTHSQGIYNLRRDLFLALGERLKFSEEQFEVHHLDGAGCYGHNGADDVAFDAARLSLEAPTRPVRVQWTRAQELACSPFSPAMLVEAAATLEPAQLNQPARIHTWKHVLWSNGHSLRPGRAQTPTLLGASELNPSAPRPLAMNASEAMGYGSQRNAIPGYNFVRMQIEEHRLLEMPIRSSAFRALGAIANVLAIESLMDEVSVSLDEDRIAFRLRHLQGDDEALTRARTVINKVAQMADWSVQQQSLQANTNPDTGLGIAYARYKNTGAWCAVVARVKLTHLVTVEQLWIAADLGLIVHENGARNQFEGAAIQATSIALKEEAKYASDLAEPCDWAHYPILKFSEIPLLDIAFIDRTEAPSLGAGEPATAPVIAAISSAISQLIGTPIRRLPFDPETIAAAIHQTTMH